MKVKETIAMVNRLLPEFSRFEENDNCLFSVSYTHLRAHETVLDLVCRLLLEKKKNNKYKSSI